MTLILGCLTSIVLLFYTWLLLHYKKSWIAPHSHISIETPSESLDIIISIRNEELNILKLIHNLKKLDYPPDLINFYLINDHSVDNTLPLMLKESKGDKRFNILNLNNDHQGKKAALSYAIKNSKGNFILFTDADCTFHTLWAKEMVLHSIKTNSDLLLAPVLFYMNSGFIQKFANFEFTTLMGVTSSATHIKKPVMSNGANLLIKRNAIPNHEDIFEKKHASGDDMFLMVKLKKDNSKKISFNNSLNTIVYTKPVSSFKSFIQQRLRWFSKNKNIKDKEVQRDAIIVFLCNFIILFSSIFSIISLKFLYIFIIAILYKSIIDIAFSFPVFKAYKRNSLLKYIFIFEVFNCFYVSILTLWSLTGNFTWKNRKHCK